MLKAQLWDHQQAQVPFAHDVIFHSACSHISPNILHFPSMTSTSLHFPKSQKNFGLDFWWWAWWASSFKSKLTFSAFWADLSLILGDWILFCLCALSPRLALRISCWISHFCMWMKKANEMQWGCKGKRNQVNNLVFCLWVTQIPRVLKDLPAHQETLWSHQTPNHGMDSYQINPCAIQSTAGLDDGSL